MLDGILKALLECVKLAPRYLIAAGSVAGLLLFGSPQLIENLGMTQFAKDHRAVLGLIFLTASALVCVAFFSWVHQRNQRFWRKRKMRKTIFQRLHSLTEDEKQILRYYVALQTRSNTLRIQDGIVQSLVSAGIIYRSAGVGDMINGFSHNIGDTAWHYLNKNPELLIGTTDTYRCDQTFRLWC